MACSCSSASSVRKVIRRARLRSTDSASTTSTSPWLVAGRSRVAVVTITVVDWPRKRARTTSGAVMTKARS